MALVLTVKEDQVIRLEMNGTVVLIKHGRRYQPGRGIKLIFETSDDVKISRLGFDDSELPERLRKKS